MKQFAGLALIALLFTAAHAADAETDDNDFTFKASASGMAEVNLSRLAEKNAGDKAVKKFAKHMIMDHTKANKELLELANKKDFKVASRMDAAHDKLAKELAKLEGAEFDRKYMAGQVKDHEEAVALFEKQAKNGKDKDLKKWAEKTLPALRDHLKMAKEVNGKLKEGKDRGKDKDKE